jgi:hypothetical protein
MSFGETLVHLGSLEQERKVELAKRAGTNVYRLR